MSIEPISLVVVLTIGLASGALVAWLVARVGQSRLRAELERDRAVQSERLRAYEDVGATMACNMMDLSALVGVQAFIEKRMPNWVAGQA